MSKIISFIILLILTLSLSLNVHLYQTNKTLNQQNLVTKVIDGDSLVLSSGQEIRLVNINSPELVYCGGDQAKKRLEDLTKGKVVRLETVSRDPFHRLLALVYVGNILVNKVLLEEGLVRYDSSPSPQKDLLLATFQKARDQKKGIFSSCIAAKPEKDGCLIKGNIERNSNIKRYHFQGCSQYPTVVIEKDLGESWFCSEKEAETAGFIKSPECYGKSY